MSEQNNGGPAFPMAANEYAGHGPCWGMTLRDYFAAKAMQGWFASWNGPNPNEEGFATTAKLAYDMADAMIRAGDAA
jgi:ribonuclease I